MTVEGGRKRTEGKKRETRPDEEAEEVATGGTARWVQTKEAIEALEGMPLSSASVRGGVRLLVSVSVSVVIEEIANGLNGSMVGRSGSGICVAMASSSSSSTSVSSSDRSVVSFGVSMSVLHRMLQGREEGRKNKRR